VNPGSGTDALPKDLAAEIQNLEDLFSISTAKLKQITNHFVKELEKG
jgi:hexokinase